MQYMGYGYVKDQKDVVPLLLLISGLSVSWWEQDVCSSSISSS